MFNHQPTDYICPFCQLISGQENEFNIPEDVVFQDSNTLAFVSPKWWPKNPGHVLVIPKTHVENIYDISEGTLSQVYNLGKKISLAIKESYKCDGISFRQHNEPAGNQEVWHFHLHVFPRWKGDNLYTQHDEFRYVTPDERKPYILKLKNYFDSH